MSTRSNIKVIDQDGEILLYKHHDGYPKEMMGFLDKYMNGSGLSTQTFANDIIEFTECELSDELHGDIQYYYEVDLVNYEVDLVKYEIAAYEVNWKTREHTRILGIEN